MHKYNLLFLIFLPCYLQSDRSILIFLLYHTHVHTHAIFQNFFYNLVFDLDYILLSKAFRLF